MGTYYSEFDDMFSHLKEEKQKSLSDAAKIKDTGNSTMIGWKELLDEVTTDLIDHGYSEDKAKIDTWSKYCEAIAEDAERWLFHISDLKGDFFNGYTYID